MTTPCPCDCPWHQQLVNDVRALIMRELDPLAHLLFAWTHQAAYQAYRRVPHCFGRLLSEYGTQKQWTRLCWTQQVQKPEWMPLNESLHRAYHWALRAGNLDAIRSLEQHHYIPKILESRRYHVRDAELLMVYGNDNRLLHEWLRKRFRMEAWAWQRERERVAARLLSFVEVAKKQ